MDSLHKQCPSKEVDIDLNLLPPVCVLQVPKPLTHQKPEAYTPQLIGMGPYHHLRPDLNGKNDLIVRACYNHFMDIDEETLAWIVAIDGLFLLNILRSVYGNNLHDHHENNIDDSIFIRDFMMLENQIPFVVMRQIRKFLCLSSSEHREDIELISMFRRFCEMHSPLPLPANNEYHKNNAKETRPLHLLDLMYRLILDDCADFASMKKMNDQDQDTHEDIIHNFKTVLEVLEPIGPRTVQKLVKPINQVVANVPWTMISGIFRKTSQLWCYARVRCSPIHEDIHQIKFVQASSTLYLPVITMNAGSEVILRNLMVYEAAMLKSKLEFARYINLMSGIADATEDVKGFDYNEIVTLFSTMQRSFVRSSGSSNVEIYMEKINEYYEQRLIVRARRGLKKNIYVSWKLLPVALSISFVLLLIFQTFCSVYGCNNVWGNRG
ncbi:unnamed protein product [Withania somnifera]